ncbi:glycosyltransferase [Clostridiaceae bacterium]|nr:glycosyltransferase [Clostridiaceae bacterium]
MQKILLVDTWNKGHHKNYALGHLKALSKTNTCLIFPEKIDNDTLTITLNIQSQYLSFKEYIQLIKTTRKIIKQFHPDIIHFLTGDYLLRFFGIGLRSIGRKADIVISFHQFHGNLLKNLSIKKIFEYTKIGIVHSHLVEKQLRNMGICNLKYLTYPYLGVQSVKLSKEIRNELGIPNDKKCIGYFGATRYDKGLDILLEAIEKIQVSHFLLIAGEATDFSREFIQKKCENNNNIKVVLRYLSDREMADYMNAVDVIVLPYRKGFNGASGPLTEGIAHSKLIIGPNDGSLGELIRENDLGEVFEAENKDSLADAISNILEKRNEYTKKYLKFQKEIKIETYHGKYRNILMSMSNCAS